MSYTDLGYNQYLTREDNFNDSSNSQLDPLSFDNFTDSISASKISSGVMVSQDGKVVIDFDNKNIIINDGAVERVKLGRLPDDSYGLLIKDSNDNTLMQISEDVNFVQSANGRTKLDFSLNKLTVKDEGGLTRIILGDF